jgi:hypothetical protein
MEGSLGVVQAPLQCACQPLEALIYLGLVVSPGGWVLGWEQDCGRGAARSATWLLLRQQNAVKAAQDAV